VLRVKRSFDPTLATFGRPKSKHGIRTIPITAALAPYLREHALRSGRRTGLVFGATATRPLDSRRLQDRADEAWLALGLTRVTLHACRHLYASMSIAAGVNAHALCRYMGHSSIAVTFDLYGHLFPGNESEAAAFLDAYLERAFASPIDRIGSL
jgi:integrase